jgi:hypothetical protein
LLDAYFANSSADGSKSRGVLYHNNGKGGFEDVTQKAGIKANGLGMGAYWGDLNNDGHPDLFLTNNGPNLLFQNNGNGTFTDVTAKAGVEGGEHWHLSAAIADFDHDGTSISMSEIMLTWRTALPKANWLTSWTSFPLAR